MLGRIRSEISTTMKRGYLSLRQVPLDDYVAAVLVVFMVLMGVALAMLAVTIIGELYGIS